MNEATTSFFEGLAERGEEPLLEKSSGTLRFDLVNGKKTQHWHVTITRGRMRVSHENNPADCVVRSDKALFDTIARGEVDAMAALLRGAVIVTANSPHKLEVLMLFQRLFPGPPPGWREDRLAAPVAATAGRR